MSQNIPGADPSGNNLPENQNIPDGQQNQTYGIPGQNHQGGQYVNAAQPGQDQTYGVPGQNQPGQNQPYGVPGDANQGSYGQPNQPYGQPNPSYAQQPKKSRMGLWIGLAVLGLLLIIGLIALLTMLLGGKDKFDSYDEFTSKMKEASAAGGLDKCHNYSDTLLNTFASEEEFRKEIAKSESKIPADSKIYICSDVDLTSFEEIANVTGEPKMNLGIYTGDDADTFDQLSKSDGKADETFKWGLAGKNWATIGSEPDVKKAKDIMGGEEIEFKK